MSDRPDHPKVPGGVLELTQIPTLGPKKAMLLYEDLGVTSIDGLRDAIHAGYAL